MRDIKFKAKRVDNGEWTEGHLCKGIGKNSIYIMPKPFISSVIFNNIEETSWDVEEDGHMIGGWFEVIPSSVCQYTGIKDKNDMEIYEGDECVFIDHPTNIDSCTTYVSFSEGNFVDNQMGWPINHYGSDWIELTGNNIHDNK